MTQPKAERGGGTGLTLRSHKYGATLGTRGRLFTGAELAGRLAFWKWPLRDGVDPELAAHDLEEVFVSAVLFGAVPTPPARGELLTFLRRVEREAVALLATLGMPELAELLVLQGGDLRARTSMLHIASGLYAEGPTILGKLPGYIARLIDARTKNELLQEQRELRIATDEPSDTTTDQADCDVAYGRELLTLAPAAIALLAECARRVAIQTGATRERRGPERDTLRSVLFRRLAAWHLQYLGPMETKREIKRDGDVRDVRGGRSAEMAQDAIHYAARRLRPALIGVRSPPGLYDDSVGLLLALGKERHQTIARLLEEGRASLPD